MPELVMEIAGIVFTAVPIEYDGCVTPLARQERQEKMARSLKQLYAREVYRCGGRASFYVRGIVARESSLLTQ